MEDHLKRAEIIEPTADTRTVQLGHRVTIRIAGQQKTYLILGSSETDPLRGVISHHALRGAALIGGRVGEVVNINTKKQVIECQIVKIASAD